MAISMLLERESRAKYAKAREGRKEFRQLEGHPRSVAALLAASGRLGCLPRKQRRGNARPARREL